MPDATSDRYRRFRIRVLGAFIAMGVCAPLPVIQMLLAGRVDLAQPITLLLPLAVPVAALLGARHAVRACDTREFPIRIALAFAVQAVLIGAALVPVTLYFASLTPDAAPLTIESAVLGFIAVMVAGLVLYGAPMFLLAWTVAVLWWHLLGSSRSVWNRA